MSEADVHGASAMVLPAATPTVSLIGVVAQSVGTMGVSSVVALVVPLVVVTAGSGNLATWILCTAVILMVAWCISRLAQRFATSGGVYGLAAKTLGGLGGILTGWTMLLLIGALQGAVILGFGVYASQFLTLFGLPSDRLMLALTSALGLAIGWAACSAGMKDSVKVMLAIEVLTVVSVTVLMIAVLATHHGPLVDTKQLTMKGSGFHMVLLGVVLAVLSFGGFESATVLGREAKDPKRAIPIAMMSTVICAGVFWTFCSYVIFVGFEGSKLNLANLNSPLTTLSRVAGIPSYRYVVNLMVALTLLGGLIALFNSMSRFMYSMARDGIGLPSWKKVRSKNGTLLNATTTIGIVWALFTGVCIAANFGPFAVLDVQGDLSGYAFMFIYVLIALGALVQLRRERDLRPFDGACGILAIAALAYVFYETVTPFPPPATDDKVVLGVFVGTVLAFIVGYGYLKARSPDTLSRIGSSVDEDTAAVLGA